MFHIYKEIDFKREPLCYYDTEEDEYGILLEFETEEAAMRFIKSSVENGDRPEEFFDGIIIRESIEYCDSGYIDATNLYVGIDGKLYELGGTRGLE